jgi:pyruvate ferredoxin oxidoreductase alpha subunit
MANVVAMTGNEAVGTAMMQINPDVVAAFPITPQTELMHKFADYVADGEVDTELVLVESEHSAMSAAVGASSAGARVMTATSANGFALMWEIVYIAASLRLPIVMPLVNRALSGNINIHCDHSDSMGGRDSGWIQIFSENAQEAYDNTIQAVRIAEHKDVLLPVMPTLDGFILSHTAEVVELLDREKVADFIGTYNPLHPLLDTDNPVTYGPLDLQDFYFEHKRSQIEAMNHAKGVILEVAEEFEKTFGRKYGLFEEYHMDDAEVAIIVLGSTAGTAKHTIDELRKEGIKAGLIKIRVFRPFPYQELIKALENVKVIATLDRSVTFGGFGNPVFTEVRSALYDSDNRPEVIDYIYGLGGRDINVAQIRSVYEDMLRVIETGNVENRINYIGLRE